MNQRGSYGAPRSPLAPPLSPFMNELEHRSETRSIAVMVLAGIAIAGAIAYGTHHGKKTIDFLSKER